ncbi:MAG: dTDP-glucose 4,6-dehydratase [Pseudohongiellaceae bacterium]
MNILVTGAAGFIGTNFVNYWRERYPADSITVLDALTYAGNRSNLEAMLEHNGFTFVRGSICDYDLVMEVMQKHCVDTLVHFAAESHVDRSIDGPDAFIETNVVGTHTLLKAAKKLWLDNGGGNGAGDGSANKAGSARRGGHHFHHVSTDEVFGTLAGDDPAFCELTPYAPNSPYAASKAASDHLVRAYHHTYGLNVTTSNCSNNYGPYQFPEKLIPLCLVNILQGKPLPIYGDGKQIRDWLYVDDHSRGIDLILKRGRVGETYNIGGNSEYTNIDAVRLLCQLLDEEFSENGSLRERFPDGPCAALDPASSLINYVTDRPGHDTRYAIDAAKITSELGYTPAERFPGGLKKTVRWYLENESWWQCILDGSYRE